MNTRFLEWLLILFGSPWGMMLLGAAACVATGVFLSRKDERALVRFGKASLALGGAILASAVLCLIGWVLLAWVILSGWSGPG